MQSNVNFSEKKRQRRISLRVLQILFSAGLLTLLARQLPQNDLWQAMHQLPVSSLILGFLCYWFASIFVVSFNWWYLLSVLGVDVPYNQLMIANIAGFFYSAVIPSALSGDVARGLRLYRSQQQHVLIAMSLVTDRLIGLVVVGAITLVGSVFFAEQLPFNLSKPYLWVLILAGAGLAGLYIVMQVIPAWVQPYLSALQAFKTHPFALLISTVLTLIIHLLIALMLWFLVRSFWGSPKFFYCLFMIELLTIGEMLPISVAGLGMREGLYVVMLAPFGIDTPEALTISLTQFAVTMSLALFGGLIEVTRSGRPHD